MVRSNARCRRIQFSLQPVDETRGQALATLALGQHQVIAKRRICFSVTQTTEQSLSEKFIYQMAPADGHTLPCDGGLDQQRVVIEAQGTWCRRAGDAEDTEQSLPSEPARAMFRARVQ